MRDPEQQSPFLTQPAQAPTSSTRASENQIVLRRQPTPSYPWAIPEQRPVTPPRRFPTPPDLQTFALESSPAGFEVQSSPLSRQSVLKDRPSHQRNHREQIRRLPDRPSPGHVDTVPPIINNVRLISPRQALPSNFHSVFPHELFNYIQSKCFPLVYGSTDNAVVSAPTGSGKTVILEMAICKLLGSPGGENFKIVYQAPTKSLCSERARDWEQKFRHMNVTCIELTGDTSQAQARRVGSASIIVTTPEKWDSITRKWSDHRKLLEMVRLVLIDEVHILKDIRGATLEAVVSRMKTIGAHVRFVALSATVPNIEDIATWLGLNHGNQTSPARFEAFSEELRPVQLKKYVYGFKSMSNEFMFQQSLEKSLVTLLSKHSEKKPIMVFCFTRKSCEATARKLAEWWTTCGDEDKAWPAPQRQAKVLHRGLQEITPCGVAYHHAGLEPQDRTAVEQGFLHGDLLVICCTSTLAVGVNLPCHTVVLKGTVGYSNNQVQEYSDLEVMQMLGRAGRPQFDREAVGIIMTTHANVQRYSTMVSGGQVLESTLHLNLLEHLNSEIGLGTIKDISAARKWVSGTFLSVRIRQAPSHYNETGIQSAADADARMQEWCERDIRLLQEHGLISESSPFSCTEYGNAMARYMVQFETMKHLLAIHHGAALRDMLEELCKAHEFQEFRLKANERAFLRSINTEKFVRFPIVETVSEPWHKVSLIVQLYLGGCEWPNEKDLIGLKRQLATEKHIIFDRLNRLIRCLIDCKAFDGDGEGTLSALELARCLSANTWDGLPCQLAQIPGFGPVSVRKWNARGINTVKEIAEMDFHDIERLASRNPPFGRNLSNLLADFPRLQLDATLHEPRPTSVPQDEVIVTIHAHLRHLTPNKSPTWNKKTPAVTFIVVTSEGSLGFVWRGNIKQIDYENGLPLKFSVSLSRPAEVITCYFSCEEIVGTEVASTLRSQLPAEAFTLRTATPPRHDMRDSIPQKRAHETDYNDISDGDLLAALEQANDTDESRKRADEGTDEDWSQSEFPFIEDVLHEEIPAQTYEAEKMSNGRWMCNHFCRNKGLTKSGKKCSHKCCAEGLDRPRAPPVAKSAKPASKIFAIADAKKPSRNPTQKVSSKSIRPSTSSIDSTHSIQDDAASHFSDSRKRPRADSGSQTSHRTPLNKVARIKRASDFECVDISAMSDDELLGAQKSDPKKTLSSTEKGEKKITNLHRLISETTAESPRFTANYLSNTASTLSGAPNLSHRVSQASFSNFASDSDDDDFPSVEEIMKDNYADRVNSSSTTDLLSKTGRGGTKGTNKSSGGDADVFPDSVDEWFELSTDSNMTSPPAQAAYKNDIDGRLFDEAQTVRDDDPLFGDPFQVGINLEPVSSKPAASLDEPAWVAAMDPSLIESLRDVVNFLE
ncbi:ATP-dependent DNA helicase HFM1/MER3 [Microdochium nivale]|nr:ATP-dependent DNA helicase HFM1/MER3 [Microdochium nivale]